MNAPYASPAMSTTTIQVTVVDVIASGQSGELSVRWPKAERSAQAVDAAVVDRIRKQLEVLHEAERERRDAEVPVARRVLGQTLWDVLDGPERRLTRAMGACDAQGEPLELVARLRVEGDAENLASHPASAWRWELLSPANGSHPTADGRMHLVVQMGDVEPSATPRVLEHGGLRAVFMAYSPRGVEPLLDYEDEEERLLAALEKPIRDNRARVQVVEDGTLAELERRLREEQADVVHLTGHGVVTPEGPRLIMEDELGRPDAISPRDLLRVLKRAAKKPDLVVISSCHSAEDRDGTPSFAAALVAGGMPAVLGWVQPVRDDVATKAAADLYGRLCTGDTPAQAVAFVREQLREADRGEEFPSHAWGTLHLLMRDARGFRVETQGTKPLPKTSMGGEALYRYLGATGGMRVLERGFIGRRRPLQRMLRILRTGQDEDGTLVAGAAVLGMKGVGKSCLVGRVLERHSQDYGSTGIVVLHGVLDDVMVLQRFSEAARKREDDAAEAILLRDESVPQRVQRLLTAHWADEAIVVVLDDFEQNLELRDDGDARPTAQAAAYLEVLLPACQANRPKLLVTTTASFSKPSGKERTLAEVALGPFEPPMLRKLWTRMPEEDRKKVSLPAWKELGERLGRNARVLDWARTLLRGKTPEEVEAVARQAGEALSQWKDDAGPSDERVAELARLFLRTLAMDEARKRLSEDALTFVKRARVYEWPVPKEAFEGLVDGLAVELRRDVTVLQNLGMLEVGEMDGQWAHRVSPLVEPDFNVEDGERWHGVAATFWEQASKREGTGEWFERVMMAWEHALRAKDEDVAGRCGRRIDVVMYSRALYRANRALAARHVESFPESPSGLLWAGSTEVQTGDLRKGWALYERGEALALASGIEGMDLYQAMQEGADILLKLGRYEEAETRLTTAADALQDADDRGPYLRALNSLAQVQQRRGKLSEARSCLERAAAVWATIDSAEEHPDAAATFHCLAQVLQAQRDFGGARVLLDRSLSIMAKVYGTDEHPNVATAQSTLAQVLQEQGNLGGARALLERSHSILAKVHGTEEHPDVALSLYALAAVQYAQGDLGGARALFERSLFIWTKVSGIEEHPDVASTLGAFAQVLHAQGDLGAARICLERSLAIRIKVHRTEEHPDVAASLLVLGQLLLAQGDLRTARTRLGRSLSILKQMTGTEARPDVAVVLHTLASVLQAQGDFQGARTLIEQSLSIWIELYGTEKHHNVAASLHVLASVLHAQGDLGGARAFLERSLKIEIELHGTEERRGVAASLHELGRILQAQGEIGEARARFERSLAIFVRVYGTEEHPEIAGSLHSLAQVRQAQGDLRNALAAIKRSLAIFTRVFGTEEHPSVATTLHTFALILQVQGDLVGARARLEHALAIWTKVHGTEEHPDVAASLHALAELLKAQGDLEGARNHLKRSLAIKAKLYGTEEHPDVAASLHALAGLLRAQGDLEGARNYLERSLVIWDKVHGTEEHPDVAASLHILADVLQAEGQFDQAVVTYRRVLDIEAGVFGTLDQYHSAETEVSLGLLLLEMNRPDEAVEFLSHAYTVLGAQVPNHPAMNILRQLFGNASTLNANNLAHLALQARHTGEPPSEDLANGLAAMTQAGPPHDAVAVLLEATATGQPLPPAPSDLPEPVAAFVHQVLKMAQTIDIAASSEDP